MKEKQQPGGEQEPFYYQNGQSDAERLMRDHLNTPGHVISDEDLRNLKVGVDDLSPAEERFEDQKEQDEEPGKPEPPETPWEVLGS
ncbi:MAG: hypothetical protein EOO11_01740 [Chitinophagaceae bacterium]|nr:MAG: hypothetical protein EOO11_01740 [Chitinophagaceae bacterium]